MRNLERRITKLEEPRGGCRPYLMIGMDATETWARFRRENLGISLDDALVTKSVDATNRSRSTNITHTPRRLCLQAHPDRE